MDKIFSNETFVVAKKTELKQTLKSLGDHMEKQERPKCEFCTKDAEWHAKTKYGFLAVLCEKCLEYLSSKELESTKKKIK